MKKHVIDDGLYHQKREMVYLEKGDVVDYKDASFLNVKEILINEERNEKGEIVVFLISEDGKEIAYIRIPEKVEIIHEGSISYTDGNKLMGKKGRIIKIVPQEMGRAIKPGK